jgi:hypothetical protein
MSEPTNDPSANTQAFQAWVDQRPGQTKPETPAKSKTPTIVITVVVALVVLGALGWLAFG